DARRDGVRARQVARLRRAEVEDRLRRAVARDDPAAEAERRPVQVVVDDVERRRVELRDLDAHDPVRVLERDLPLLELPELARARRRDLLDDALARAETHL